MHAYPASLPSIQQRRQFAVVSRQRSEDTAKYRENKWTNVNCRKKFNGNTKEDQLVVAFLFYGHTVRTATAATDISTAG